MRDRLGPGAVIALIGSAVAVAGAIHAARNARRLPHLRNQPGVVTEAVSVLVPARDEEANIGACLRALTHQRGVSDLEILVGDDDSGDRTAELVAAAAHADRRVRLVDVPAPAPGWLGKPNACAHLAAVARGKALVFVDADVRLQPHALSQAVTQLRTGHDLLSAWPQQLGDTPLARLVQPLQQWSWLTTLPLGVADRSRRPQLVAANGQFLVGDAAAYRMAGGHAAVSDQVLDDIGLARAFKRAGGRVGLADASDVAACLMYDTDADLVAGYAKSLWTAFGGPARGLLVTAGLAVVYVAPPMYAVLGRHRMTRFVAATGYAAGVCGRVVSARATGGRVWPDALAHPASMAALAALTTRSVRDSRRGRLTWRGRGLPTTPPG
jgi:glycosyltransferase involved in cell wall biosynthesis